MPCGLTRFQESHQLHFLTFSCYKRRPKFQTVESRTTFESALERVRQNYQLCVYGYVVMPEHVHMLADEPERSTLAQAIKSLKQGVAPTGPTRRRAVLVGAVLRFQRVERTQVRGETSLHLPQSRRTRAGHEAGGLAVEQLPSLSDRRAPDDRRTGKCRCLLLRLFLLICSSPVLADDGGTKGRG